MRWSHARRIAELEKAKKTAMLNEDFERCAAIRDQINTVRTCCHVCATDPPCASLGRDDITSSQRNGWFQAPPLVATLTARMFA